MEKHDFKLLTQFAFNRSLQSFYLSVQFYKRNLMKKHNLTKGFNNPFSR